MRCARSYEPACAMCDCGDERSLPLNDAPSGNPCSPPLKLSTDFESLLPAHLPLPASFLPCGHLPTGFADTQYLLGIRLQPEYGGDLRLDDEDLQTAAHQYGSWLAEKEERMRQGLARAPDPLAHCPICQRTFRTQLNNGESWHWQEQALAGTSIFEPAYVQHLQTSTPARWLCTPALTHTLACIAPPCPACTQPALLLCWVPAHFAL